MSEIDTPPRNVESQAFEDHSMTSTDAQAVPEQLAIEDTPASIEPVSSKRRRVDSSADDLVSVSGRPAESAAGPSVPALNATSDAAYLARPGGSGDLSLACLDAQGDVVSVPLPSQQATDSADAPGASGALPPAVPW